MELMDANFCVCVYVSNNYSSKLLSSLTHWAYRIRLIRLSKYLTRNRWRGTVETKDIRSSISYGVEEEEREQEEEKKVGQKDSNINTVINNENKNNNNNNINVSV